MRAALKTLVALIALATAWHAGAPATTPAAGDGVRAGPPETAPRPPPAGGMYRGMAIQLHCNSSYPDVFEHYRRLIPEIVDLGAETVLFVVHAWQEHAGSLDMKIDPRRTAKTEHLGQLCDLAHRRGLRVILMPIVLLKNPRNNEWRGQIIPKNRDWDAWFRRYTQINVHFAQIAERHRVEAMTIGSELIKAEAYTSRWRRLIEEVRQHYRGKLGYSANWDHYQTDKIRFWPQLDFVGMTTYYKLAEGPRPSIAELDAHWAKIKPRILEFQREVNKPIIFTEVGWCSQEGAAREAWNYYQNQKATPEGHAEQANCYRSFLGNWDDEPAVGGIIWWEWGNTRGGAQDYNYTPRGKPAEQILRRWFAKKAAPTGADRRGTDEATP